jgi:hypothetical protein
MVAQALRGGVWMKGEQRISSLEEVRQFVSLWIMVNNITLTDQPDDIA